MDQVTRLPRIGGPIHEGVNGFMLIPYLETWAQAYTAGGANDVYWDNLALGGTGSLIVGAFPQTFAAQTSACFRAVSYPGFQAEENCGYFSRYSTGIDAEILNLFSDEMYIGPYSDPAAGTAGTMIIYRGGRGNEGDGTWFVNGLLKEISYNIDRATVDAGTGYCYSFYGLAGDTTKPLVHWRATAVGTVVQKLSSAATNDDPIEQTVQNRVATTDATVTTIHSFLIQASNTYYITATVVARRTGGAAGTADDGAAYEIKAAYQTSGGVVKIIGVATKISFETTTAYDINFVVSGSNVLLQVTGVASTNITWHMTARYYNVGS
jgi:hypothetical protein